ncbi:MAG: hypothetical protein ACTSO9_17710 [Candidatus Helarchaeota archaeon]
MKIVNPDGYFRKIRRRFRIDPIYDIDVDKLVSIKNEIEKRIKIGQLFIPEIENAGSYDLRYDIAATIVMSLPDTTSNKEVIDFKVLILENLINKYKINSFLSWTTDCMNDVVFMGEIFYHPCIIPLVFANYRMPVNRTNEFREFLLALQIYRNNKIPAEWVLHLYNYYGFKTPSLVISDKEIEIIKELMPKYPRNIEKMNAFLQYMYEGKVRREGTIVGNLIRKTNWDYRTVKAHLEELRSNKLLRSVNWLDFRVFDLVSISILHPDTSTRLSIPYIHVYRKLYGERTIGLEGLHAPEDQIGSLYYFLKEKLRIPFKFYINYTLPIISFNYDFIDRSHGGFNIDWELINEHFKNCEIIKNSDIFEPLIPPVIKYDKIMLEIASFLSGNAQLTNTQIAKALNRDSKTIMSRREILKQYSITFPYPYNLGIPELYILFIYTNNIGELNYIIEFFSILPQVYYMWCQNFNDNNDCLLIVYIHLPKGSFNFIKYINKNFKIKRYEIFTCGMRTYMPFMALYSMYDEQKKRLYFDFNKISIINF